MTEREIQKLLKKNGWEIVQGAGHAMAINNPLFPGKKIPIPRHRGDIPKGTVKAILKQAELE